jgi:hypothetical protein
MIVIYQALNSIDAHLLRGLLAQRGVHAAVAGEFLQGGAGELPAGGVVSVVVAADDVDLARSVVREFEDNMRVDPDWEEAGWQIEAHALADADRRELRDASRRSPLFESPEVDMQYWLWTGVAGMAAIALAGWVLHQLPT